MTLYYDIKTVLLSNFKMIKIRLPLSQKSKQDCNKNVCHVYALMFNDKHAYIPRNKINHLWNYFRGKRKAVWNFKYSRLSLSRSPRDSLNTSRYPYLDISDLQNWGKQLIEQVHFTNEYVIWLLKLEIYSKYCGKEEKLLFFSTIFCYLIVRFPC